jgi:predicted ribosome quality control (RQC) complex YloA/Tae2 family protein
MSLNWKEIDLILSELDLAGSKIERVSQPSFDSIAFGLYKGGQTTELFVSIAQGACRIHSLRGAPPKPTRPLRFMECLRSRIRGGRIESVRQLGRERVVRFDISVVRAAEEQPSSPATPLAEQASPGPQAREGAATETRRYVLYARLWSGAGNLVLADEDGIVVDALARRPKKGEVSGARCAIEEGLAAAAATGLGPGALREFEPRDLPGPGSFNERVEAFYAAQGGELSRERLIESARERFRKRETVLGARIAELEARQAEFRDAERLRELGDILMANQGAAYDGAYLACEDFYRGGEIRVPVDPRRSVVANAQVFYERHHKAKSGLAELEAELGATRASLEAERRELARIESLEDPFLIARALAKGGTARDKPKRRPYPGLSLEREGWTILVGRNAKENDELLRRHVRGSDLWLHARDWPGSYVFVKARKDKSVPLEILLDAGNLAIYYSKGRSSGGGDLYYTFVKYLRRAKDGPKGLVIPTQEKNLTVELDETRLKELRSLIGEDA